MGDILAGFLRRSGALVSVEGREFRWVNGRQACLHACTGLSCPWVVSRTLGFSQRASFGTVAGWEFREALST